MTAPAQLRLSHLKSPIVCVLPLPLTVAVPCFAVAEPRAEEAPRKEGHVPRQLYSPVRVAPAESSASKRSAYPGPVMLQSAIASPIGKGAPYFLRSSQSVPPCAMVFVLNRLVPLLCVGTHADANYLFT